MYHIMTFFVNKKALVAPAPSNRGTPGTPNSNRSPAFGRRPASPHSASKSAIASNMTDIRNIHLVSKRLKSVASDRLLWSKIYESTRHSSQGGGAQRGPPKPPDQVAFTPNKTTSLLPIASLVPFVSLGER